MAGNYGGFIEVLTYMVNLPSFILRGAKGG